MNIKIEVIWKHEEVAYYAIFSGAMHGIDFYWNTYIPDMFVISENGELRLIDSALHVLIPIAELAIEMTAAKRAAA